MPHWPSSNVLYKNSYNRKAYSSKIYSCLDYLNIASDNYLLKYNNKKKIILKMNSVSQFFSIFFQIIFFSSLLWKGDQKRCRVFIRFQLRNETTANWTQIDGVTHEHRQGLKKSLTGTTERLLRTKTQTLKPNPVLPRIDLLLLCWL